MARLAHEEGLLLDVATGGELHVALAAGVPADRLVFHGNNKSMDELRTALTARRRPRWSSTASTSWTASTPSTPRASRCRRIQLRVTPGVEAHTHEFVRTGQEDSKFGFGLPSGAAAEATERALRSPVGRAGRLPRPRRLAGLRGRELRPGGRA